MERFFSHAALPDLATPVDAYLDCLVIWEYGQRNNLWFRPEQRFRSHAEFFVEKLRPFS